MSNKSGFGVVGVVLVVVAVVVGIGTALSIFIGIGLPLRYLPFVFLRPAEVVEDATCKLKGGNMEWSHLASRTCVIRTIYKDGGKTCTNSDQCEGRCVTSDPTKLGVKGVCEKDTNPQECATEITEDIITCIAGDIGYAKGSYFDEHLGVCSIPRSDVEFGESSDALKYLEHCEVKNKVDVSGVDAIAFCNDYADSVEDKDYTLDYYTGQRICLEHYAVAQRDERLCNVIYDAGNQERCRKIVGEIFNKNEQK